MTHHPLTGYVVAFVGGGITWTLATVSKATTLASPSAETMDVILKFFGCLIAIGTALKIAWDLMRAWNARPENWWKLWQKPWKKSNVDSKT